MLPLSPKPFRRALPSVIDGVLVFALAALLVLPLFRLGYMNNWASIESTFIADARYLAAHWPHPNWQPLWYGGTRFDYVYPPVLRYGTAALVHWFGLLPVRAYHIFVAFFYALGIAGAYVLIRAGTRARAPAWLGAAAIALVSPSFLFLPVIRLDSEYMTPQRLHVLAKYGEGPHISGLGLLEFALAAAIWAFRGGSPTAIAIAAVFAALTALTNFYAATALAILFPALAFSYWITQRDRRVWFRAATIAALAGGLSAFWLTPSYLGATLRNLSIVAQPGNSASLAIALVVAAVFVLLAWAMARGRPDRAWTVFVIGAVLAISVDVLGFYSFGFRVAGEPARFVPELDLVLILGAVEALRRLWKLKTQPAWIPRLSAVALVLLSFYPGRHYLFHAWNIFPAEPDYTSRLEYQAQQWMTDLFPDRRVYVTGSIRFWFNVWHDTQQVGGGSEQGLLNPNVTHAQWEFALGSEARPSVLWLTALGADALLVPDKTSKEIYHDFTYPHKFAGVLPVVRDDHAGNVIYRVPRRYPALARVVDRARVMSLGPVRNNADVERLQPYVDALENGPASPVEFRWEGSDAIRLRARLDRGQALLVQVAWDPCWKAYAGDRRLEVRSDAFGHMLIDAPPGERDVRLAFAPPFENAAGRAVTVFSLLLAAALAAGVTGRIRHAKPR